MVKDMCIYSQEDLFSLQHCMYKTFLENPRIYFDDAAKKCNSCRNTVSKYWREGLENLIFFPPQIRLNMFEDRKEYIYLIQSNSPLKLFNYFKKQSDMVYITYTSGKFDILLQTSKLLDVLPDRTIFFGSRSNYIYPETPNYSSEKAFERMEALLDQNYSKSTIPVHYPEEPPEKGSSHYGWMIFPYVKYDLKTGYTEIVKKLHISFDSFHSGLNYLLNISTKLLPYYPLGFRLYSQYFFVFWSDYEEFLYEFLGCMPCHVSITKVDNKALVVLLSIQKGAEMSEKLFYFSSKMADLGLIDYFWMS
jgi:hypothetical protein